MGREQTVEEFATGRQHTRVNAKAILVVDDQLDIIEGFLPSFLEKLVEMLIRQLNHIVVDCFDVGFSGEDVLVLGTGVLHILEIL